ncbi:MAG: hypothetical protein HY423_12160 [Candidatus Lambdaproteobacteria bacterium]|nr:hypothetical protein [Candidatus Lambdaproteobacteria bacterium]
MTRLMLASMLLLAPAVTALGTELGAFFTRVNTYLYTPEPLKGARLLLRAREILPVQGIRIEPGERVWYLVAYPHRTRRSEGQGWTPFTPHELKTKGSEPVEVFSAIVDRFDMTFTTEAVPARDLRLLAVSQVSDLFPAIEWQKVTYVTPAPLAGWVRASSGIFRPGFAAGPLEGVYAEMVARNVAVEKLARLLSGVVRVGDSTQDVRWALGAPLRVQDEGERGHERTTWHYPGLVVHIENGAVKQIN